MKLISRQLRKDSLLLSKMCQDGNLQSVFSCMEIVWTLYDRIMNWSPRTAQDPNRDFFIISKGQATLALFPVLIQKGLFTLEDLQGIGTFKSRFSIQTDVTKFSGGVENSAGSLGHGFPFATGIATANKIIHSPSNVYVLVGDGELCEGTMWESCLWAADRKLDNLFMIVDDNHSVGALVDMGAIGEKLAAFGFEVFETPGHDLDALEKTFRSANNKNGKPKAILAKTVRGYGSRTMTEQDIWFHKSPNEEEYKMLCSEVDSF